MNTEMCSAITVGDKATFDVFDTLDGTGVMTLYPTCRKHARYQVSAHGVEQRACRDHVALLLDGASASADWDGSMIAVTVL